MPQPFYSPQLMLACSTEINHQFKEDSVMRESNRNIRILCQGKTVLDTSSFAIDLTPKYRNRTIRILSQGKIVLDTSRFDWTNSNNNLQNEDPGSNGRSQQQRNITTCSKTSKPADTWYDWHFTNTPKTKTAYIAPPIQPHPALFLCEFCTCGFTLKSRLISHTQEHPEFTKQSGHSDITNSLANQVDKPLDKPFDKPFDTPIANPVDKPLASRLSRHNAS
eukprot:1014984_1